MATSSCSARRAPVSVPCAARGRTKWLNGRFYFQDLHPRRAGLLHQIGRASFTRESDNEIGLSFIKHLPISNWPSSAAVAFPICRKRPNRNPWFLPATKSYLYSLHDFCDFRFFIKEALARLLPCGVMRGNEWFGIGKERRFFTSFSLKLTSTRSASTIGDDRRHSSPRWRQPFSGRREPPDVSPG